MLILKGKPVADKILNQLAEQVKNWSEKGMAPPHLAVVLVGQDPASSVYVGHKQKACQQIGFKSTLLHLAASTSQSELERHLQNLSANSDVDAILLQLPLPVGLNPKFLIQMISADKDADALTFQSMGKLMSGDSDLASCTPAGVIEILNHYQLSVKGQNVLVIGRSQIVGLPLFHLLNQQNATVTLAHSKTQNLKQLVKEFDFVFVAIGQKHFFKTEDFKKGAVVIDIGIHRTEDGLKGDVDFNNAESWLSAYTPVPGGVGPMTIAMLMKNTWSLAARKRKFK